MSSAEESRAYYQRNKERLRERARAYRAANREKIAAQRKVRYEAYRPKVAAYNKVYNQQLRNKRRTADRDYRRLYGITLDQVEEMIQDQLGLCDICGKQMDGKRDLNVDHNHETMVVRSLLCRDCNNMIANAQENIGIMVAGIEYLIRHEQSEEAAA